MVVGTATVLQRFSSICEIAFGSLLRAHGFSAVEGEIRQASASQFYANGSRYIGIFVNLDPRDAPFHCVLVLGDGGRDMPERDWNGVALWRLTPDQHGHVIAGPEHIEQTLALMAGELRDQAADFLKGDVQRFLRLRAEQNRAREPYQIWEPDGAGRYVSRPDPESAELKRRFSEAP